MNLGIPKESHPGERRVAASPAAVKRFVELGFDVIVEAGAGDGASYPDAAFEAAGASIGSAEAAFGADGVLKVRAPRDEEGARELDLNRGAIAAQIRSEQHGQRLHRKLQRGHCHCHQRNTGGSGHVLRMG